MSTESPSRKLYLDDLRDCPEGWECCRSYADFVASLVESGLPGFISFDHDLGTELTGYDCAKFLVGLDRGLLPAGYAVHSRNPVGAANIQFVLESYAREIWRRALGNQ